MFGLPRCQLLLTLLRSFPGFVVQLPVLHALLLHQLQLVNVQVLAFVQLPDHTLQAAYFQPRFAELILKLATAQQLLLGLYSQPSGFTPVLQQRSPGPLQFRA